MALKGFFILSKSVVVATLKNRKEEKEMNRKFLEKLELSEEQIAQIMAEHGKSTQELQNKLSAAEGNATSLQNQLDERDKDLKALKKESEDNAELLQKYNDLDKKYKTQKEEHDLEMADMKLNHAISMQISNKVHDASIVNGLLDKSKLSLDENGGVKGLDNQLTALKESKGFLFVPEMEPATGHVAGAKPQGAIVPENNNNDVTAQMIEAFTA